MSNNKEKKSKASSADEKNNGDINIEIEDNNEIEDNISDNKEQDSADNDVEAIVNQLNDLEKERDELKDQLMRKAAELENVRRRTQREKQDLISYANERLLHKLVEILDDMEKAVDAGRDNDDYKALYQGIELIKSKSFKLFEEAGVKPMEELVGSEFNVDFHEALMHIPSEDIPEGHIVQVVQNGYILHDKVLRHAKVITSAGKQEEK